MDDTTLLALRRVLFYLCDDERFGWDWMLRHSLWSSVQRLSPILCAALVRHFVTLGQDLDIIQVNGFPALMDDPHKMITGREPRGRPHKVEGLLVEAVWLIVNEYRHRPEIPPALIAQIESLPCKAEGYFIPNAS